VRPAAKRGEEVVARGSLAPLPRMAKGARFGVGYLGARDSEPLGPPTGGRFRKPQTITG
jgi:hypothetical protein